MKRLLLSLPLLATLVAEAPAQDLQGPSWKPQAFQVMKPDADEKSVLRDASVGTRVVARLGLLGQKFITIDPVKSKLDSFTDDLKTDLLAAPAVGALPFARASLITGGRSGLSGARPNDITFHAPGCPSRGATKVRIKGTVTVIVGKDEKTIEKKDVVLKAGVDLDIGSLKPLADRFANAPGALGRSTMLSYDGTKAISAITLLDADGKEIPCRFTMTYRPATANTKETCRASVLVTDRTVERCTVRIKYFDSVEEVKVPVDLEVGPGL
jgi:hypothetical protein